MGRGGGEGGKRTIYIKRGGGASETIKTRESREE